ncbi:ribonuclease T [Erythrobacter sp. KY5]|uniref:ribonuclease T2 family protein n=1 Tax=Erythrobacter sp. KY5 TaxID=2011159 RepID=UPI001F48339C|nr:ribonuclease T [Erythrobacter sp. KY5]
MITRRIAASLSFLAMTEGGAAVAHAQAYQCRSPSVASVPQIAPDGPRRDTPVTGYTLALSWSPEFCKPREESRAHRVQCSGDNGRFGLVVHGLWPQSARGSWPQWCAAQTRLTPAQIRKHMCMMPSARLIARQWAKHGSCMTKRPQTYLGVTRILWNSLRIPDYDRISREDGLTAGRIRSAFADANGSSWQPGHIGVKLNERGWLQEIRLCYSRRFRPTRCDDARFGARDDVAARIWRGL